MCGICGQINADRSRPVDRMVLGRMNEELRQRGPDSAGFHVHGNVGIAMRRLAVIDLETGDQPISNEDGSVWVVLNGEIYNFRELRKQLEARGHVFRTQADTETLVHLYEDYGDELVEKLRGMFAFALWDERRQRLLAARDRVGMKPFYYAEHDGAFLFASEIKSILRFPGFPREVNLEAIHHFLTLQYVPDPLSGFQNVRKLPPAHRLVWENGAVFSDCYWDLCYEPKLSGSAGELRERVREKITEAVRIRLISDVPLGAHLSGGVDSSIVVGLMAGMTDHPVRTFSIGFSETPFSELSHAKEAAQAFGTDHHEFILEPDALELLPCLVEHFDEPFADPAAIPTWHLARLTREHVTVALNGDGGDEGFAGYHRYYADIVADLYRRLPPPIRHSVFDPLLARLPVHADRPTERSPATALRRLSQAADFTHGASIVRWGDYFTDRDKSAMYTLYMRQAVDGIATIGLLESSFLKALASNRVDRTLYTDVHNYLPGALLPKVDRMTMAHSLEARSPLLDHEVLELAARLPPRQKVKGTVTKSILRDAFADTIPPNLRHRPKMGFIVPLGLWFRGPLRDLAMDVLVSGGAFLHDYVRRESVEMLLREHLAGKADHGKRLWALLNLESWFQRYTRKLP